MTRLLKDKISEPEILKFVVSTKNKLSPNSSNGGLLKRQNVESFVISLSSNCLEHLFVFPYVNYSKK